jgi:starch synthase
LADGSATGFAFDMASPQALRAAIERSRKLVAEPALWWRMVRQAMTGDFSWAAAARHYLALDRAL